MNPNNWKSVALSDVAAFSSGRTPSRSRQSDYFDNGSIPWVKTMDLTNSSITETDEFITRRAVQEVHVPILPVGTVLVAMYGGFNQIGRTGILRMPATTNQALTAILPDNKRLNSDYLIHVLNYKVSHWRTVASSSRKDPNITKDDVKSFPLTLPPIHEQAMIAAAINDAGKHISALAAMIASREAFRLGLMQQLLTGSTRLPGFNGKWVTRTWGELSNTISSGATPRRSRSDYWNGDIPWVTSTELKRDIIQHIPQAITRSGLQAANLTIWPAGTFLMAITGLEAAGTRGSCGILKVPAATNQSCMAIIPGNQLDTDFLFFYYLLRGEELAFQYTQGTKQQSYTAAIVRTLPIRLPTDVAEQRAISAALRDATTEIRKLHVRLDKARDVKQGMMQQLLTGRTRLPI